MRIIRALAGNLILLALSLGIGLVLCEALVRTVAPQRLDQDKPVYVEDDFLVFKLRKNHHAVFSQFEFTVLEHTNRLGLRDREIETKPPDGFRVLALGDSYTFGHGVPLEESFVKRLERGLQAVTDRPVEVINAGVPAYSLLQSLRYLQRDGLALQPDAVLYGLYIGNDLVDSYDLFDEQGRSTMVVVDGKLVSRKAHENRFGFRTLTRPVRHWLAAHSHLYVLLRNRYSEVLMTLGWRNIPVPSDFIQKRWTPLMEKQWALTRKLLLEAASITRQHDLPFVVLLIPTLYQVHETRWNEYIKTFGVDPAAYDLDQPQRLLRAFCAEQGIVCVDVLPLMREAGKTQPLYYRVDSHLNTAGHRLVAQALLPYFVSMLEKRPAEGHPSYESASETVGHASPADRR